MVLAAIVGVGDPWECVVMVADGVALLGDAQAAASRNDTITGATRDRPTRVSIVVGPRRTGRKRMLDRPE